MTTKQHCICQLQALVSLLNAAANKAAADNWEAVTDILQGRATPLLQTVSHDAWLQHHKSGSGQA